MSGLVKKRFKNNKYLTDGICTHIVKTLSNLHLQSQFLNHARIFETDINQLIDPTTEIGCIDNLISRLVINITPAGQPIDQFHLTCLTLRKSCKSRPQRGSPYETKVSLHRPHASVATYQRSVIAHSLCVCKIAAPLPVNCDSPIFFNFECIAVHSIVLSDSLNKLDCIVTLN